MRAPLMETQQHGSIRVKDLTPVIMGRTRFGLPKEQLVPFAADRNVSDADNGPCALHCCFPALNINWSSLRIVGSVQPLGVNS